MLAFPLLLVLCTYGLNQGLPSSPLFQVPELVPTALWQCSSAELRAWPSFNPLLYSY